MALVGKNITQYTNNGLPAATNFWYRVRVYDGSATEHPYSAVMQTSTYHLPTDVLVSTVNDTTADVTWDYGGLDPHSFLIQKIEVHPYHQLYSNDIDQLVDVIQLPGTARSYRMTNLVDAQGYRFKVIPGWYDYGTAGTLAVTASDPQVNVYVPGIQQPTGLSYSVVNSRSINFTWRDNSLGNNGYAIRTLDSNGNVTGEQRVMVGNLTSYSLGVAPESTPRVEVCAISEFPISGGGDRRYSNPSNRVTVTMPSNIPGENLTSVSITATGVGSESGSETGSFTLTRGGSTANALTVQLHPLFGNATPGVDFASLQTSYTIPAGASSVPIPITVLNDWLIERTEHIFMGVKASGSVLASGAWATLLLRDDGNRISGKPLQLKYDAADHTKFNQIIKDGHINADGTPDQNAVYGDVQWKDGDGDGDAELDDEGNGIGGDILAPIAYARSRFDGVTDVVGEVEVKIKLANVDPNGVYRIRGNGPFDIDFPATAADRDGDVLTAIITADRPMPWHVFKWNFEVNWQISNDPQGAQNTWVTAGKTNNTAYFTNIDLTNPVVHTVLDIACRNAGGLNDPAEIAMAIWDDFKLKNPNQGVKRADGKPMKYWAGGEGPEKATHATLIKEANGRCGAWADLLVTVLTTQGVSANRVNISPKYDVVDPLMAPHFNPPPNTGGDKLYMQIDPALPGQGNPTPKSAFEVRRRGGGLPELYSAGHVVVRITGMSTVFDPSYGKEYQGASLEEAEQRWESTALKGWFWRYFIQDGTSQDGNLVNQDPNARDTIFQ